MKHHSFCTRFNPLNPISSDFVTSASSVPDAQKCLKTQIIHGMRPVGRKEQSNDLKIFW